MREQKMTKSRKKPDEVDRYIAALLIENPNVTDTAMANRLEVSRATINRKRRGANVQSLVAEALSIPTSEIQRLVVKSLRKVEGHIDDQDPRISLAAAKTLLQFSTEAQRPGNASIESVPTDEEYIEMTAELEEKIRRKLNLQFNVLPLMSLEDVEKIREIEQKYKIKIGVQSHVV